MITGTVSSSELSAKKGPRAEDDLIDPTELAKDLVWTWLASSGLEGLFRSNGAALKRLRSLVSAAVRHAYERGQKQASARAEKAEQELEEERHERKTASDPAPRS